MPGAITSPLEAEITNIERDGFWLLVGNEEFFVPFSDYPDFQAATISQIHDFRFAHEHFHWPELDVDIELDALRHPERFPLRYKK